LTGIFCWLPRALGGLVSIPRAFLVSPLPGCPSPGNSSNASLADVTKQPQFLISVNLSDVLIYGTTPAYLFFSGSSLLSSLSLSCLPLTLLTPRPSIPNRNRPRGSAVLLLYWLLLVSPSSKARSARRIVILPTALNSRGPRAGSRPVSRRFLGSTYQLSGRQQLFPPLSLRQMAILLHRDWPGADVSTASRFLLCGPVLAFCASLDPAPFAAPDYEWLDAPWSRCTPSFRVQLSSAPFVDTFHSCAYPPIRHNRQSALPLPCDPGPSPPTVSLKKILCFFFLPSLSSPRTSPIIVSALRHCSHNVPFVSPLPM